MKTGEYFSNNNGFSHDFTYESLVLFNAPRPTKAEFDAVYETFDIKEQIKALEAQITPRRLREAVLGVDGGWLAQQEAAIVALREQL